MGAVDEVLMPTDEVIFSRDVIGNKFLYVSNSWERVFGYCVDRLLTDADAFLQSVHPDDRELFARANEELAKGGTVTVVFRIVRPDDSVRWLFAKRVPVIRNGVLTRVQGFLRDVTDDLQVKQDLDARETACREMKKCLEELMFMLSHQVRQPVTQIVGCANLLEIDDSEQTLRQLTLFMKKSALLLQTYTEELTAHVARMQDNVSYLC